MFLFAIAPTAAVARPDILSVRQFSVGAWTVTAATDDWYSSVQGDEHAVTVREAGPLQSPRTTGIAPPGKASNLLFAEVRFRAGDRSLELFKSPLGGRFLYYHRATEGLLYCASHVALLRQAGVAVEEDPRQLPELFLYRYVTPPGTPFKDVYQVQAGEWLRFEWDGRTWRRAASTTFSPPRATAGPGESSGETGVQAHVERTAGALRGAMAVLGASDPRPRVLLSGGLDSSILFRLAQAQLGVEDSYSAGYPFESDEEDVERKYARTAAEAMGARHHLVVPTTERFLRGLLEAAAAMDEPVVHLQSVLMLLMLRDGMPPERAPVVIGEGADGAFGMSVHTHRWALDRRAGQYKRLRPVLGRQPMLGALRRACRLLGRGGDLLEVMERVWEPHHPLTDPRHALWRQHVVCDEQWVRDRFGAAARDAVNNRLTAMMPYQGRSVYDLFSLQSFLADAALVQRQWSRLAESVGKWAYYPFHDPAVLEAAYATPWDVKLAEPKAVLRGVARGIGVPEFIITRPKADFSANRRHWALPGGVLEPLIPLAARVWGERELREVQAKTARALNKVGARAPSASTFLAMLNYAMWKRMCINGESLSNLTSELGDSLQAGAHAATAKSSAA